METSQVSWSSQSRSNTITDDYDFDDLLTATNADEFGTGNDLVPEPEVLNPPHSGPEQYALDASGESISDQESKDATTTESERAEIQTPPELEGPNGDLALEAYRMQHESIMNALRNIR